MSLLSGTERRAAALRLGEEASRRREGLSATKPALEALAGRIDLLLEESMPALDAAAVAEGATGVTRRQRWLLVALLAGRRGGE